jgi:hypothetical protein
MIIGAKIKKRVKVRVFAYLFEPYCQCEKGEKGTWIHFLDCTYVCICFGSITYTKFQKRFANIRSGST